MIRENQILAWRFFLRKVVSQMRSDCYKSVDALIQALQSEDSAARGGAAVALRKIGSHKAIDALIQCLE